MIDASFRSGNLGVLISFVISAMTLNAVVNDGFHFSGTVYERMNAGGLKMEVGFLIDGLTAMMSGCGFP